MHNMKKSWLALVLVAILLSLSLPSCGGDNGTGPSDTPPQITGCTTVSYQGVSFPSTACQMGATSATINGTVNNVTACINITCSAGCISSATLCGS